MVSIKSLLTNEFLDLIFARVTGTHVQAFRGIGVLHQLFERQTQLINKVMLASEPQTKMRCIKNGFITLLGGIGLI